MQNNIKRYSFLHNAKYFVSQEVLVTMYNSLVLPYFNYCSTIWHDNNSFTIIYSAAHVITSSDYSIRSVQIFEILQWQPIKTIYFINEN